MKNDLHNNSVSVEDIVSIGVMLALIEVSKLAMQGIPNIELTSFWLMMFTLYFGKKVLFTIPAFILLEGCIYGFGLWAVMYLYAWPILVLLTWIGRKRESVWYYSFLCGTFGLCFGFLCSFPYFFIGITEEGIQGGLHAAFTWWVAGIPWDIIHGISNFVIMLVLYKPIRNVMMRKEKDKNIV